MRNATQEFSASAKKIREMSTKRPIKRVERIYGSLVMQKKIKKGPWLWYNVLYDRNTERLSQRDIQIDNKTVTNR